MQLQFPGLEKMFSGVPGFILWVVVCILLFLLVREILAWYWKQNRIISLLEEIRDALKHPGLSRDAAESHLIASTTLKQPFTGALLAKIIGGIALAVSAFSLFGGELIHAAIGCILALGVFLIALRMERGERQDSKDK